MRIGLVWALKPNRQIPMRRFTAAKDGDLEPAPHGDAPPRPTSIPTSTPVEERRICYLCAEDLSAADDTDEHIIAKQIFPKVLRERHSLQLLTLPAHAKCNQAFQADEVYFTQSIGPLASRTVAGEALAADLRRSFKHPEGAALARNVMGEFRDQLNGIYVAPGLVAKTFDTERVHAVVWKIVRGLFFREKGRFLPEHSLRSFDIFTQHEQPESEPTLDRLRASPGNTNHAAIFDYKFIEVDHEGNAFHIWALLFWDALLWLVFFHDPECSCDRCAELRKQYPLPRTDR